MAESYADFSKILELQEIKRLYEEQQERHRSELAERDAEIERLRELVHSATDTRDSGEGELRELRAENERLGRQLHLLREEYEAKVDRLNQRVRELSDPGPPGRALSHASSARKGFFRR